VSDDHASADPRPDPVAHADPARATPDSGDQTASPVVVYWRPGCGFCQALTWELDHVGLETERRNIWDDPDAAAFVRSVAGGNETVPTVTIGPETMVNPSARDVVAAVRRHVPELLPTSTSDGGPGRLARAMRRALGEVDPGER
jgi:glutaredoxin-like protein